jgi:hypothetical protein
MDKSLDIIRYCFFPIHKFIFDNIVEVVVKKFSLREFNYITTDKYDSENKEGFIYIY